MLRLQRVLKGVVRVAVLLAFVCGPTAAQTWPDSTITQAIEAYRPGQFEKASEGLRQRLAEPLLDRDRAVAPVYLGLIDLANQRDPTEYFRDAVLADYALRADPQIHAPSRVEQYRALRARVLEVGSFDVFLSQGSLPVGGELQITTRIRNTDGMALQGLPVRYFAEGPSGVVRLSETGIARGLRPGQVFLGAELDIIPQGMISALSPGDAGVWASSGPMADSLSLEVLGASRSMGSALALGFLVPGGGEFYVGNTGRGIVALLLGGGALAWGLLSSDVTVVCAEPLVGGTCPAGSVLEERKRSKWMLGAAAAGGVALIAAIDAARVVSAAKGVGRSVSSALRRK